MSSQNEIVECIACGEEVDEEDATYGSGGVKEDGVEKLADGQTIGADELFGFDDGPYCSLACSITGDSDA